MNRGIGCLGTWVEANSGSTEELWGREHRIWGIESQEIQAATDMLLDVIQCPVVEEKAFVKWRA